MNAKQAKKLRKAARMTMTSLEGTKLLVEMVRRSSFRKRFVFAMRVIFNVWIQEKEGGAQQ